MTEKLKEAVSKLKALQRPYTEDQYDNLMLRLGQYPSIALLEDVLKTYKKLERAIAMVEVPQAMQELGLFDCTLDDGTIVEIKDIVSTKIIDEPGFIDWFKEIGYGDLLKTTLTFKREEVDDRLRKFLTDEGYTFNESFNKQGFTQQLNKVIKQRQQAGELEPPPDVLEVTNFEEAKLKPSKQEVHDEL